MTLSTPKRTRAGDKIRKQILLGWVFVAFWAIFVGGFDTYFGWSAARQIHAGRTWQRTTATVIASQIVTSRGQKGRTEFSPLVKYSYMFDGREFSGETIEAFGTGGLGQKRAEQVVGECPLGAVVPVYVDPTDPANAALRVGLQADTIKMFMLAMPFNAVLIGVTAFLLRARRSADDPMLGWVVRDDDQRAVLRLAQWTSLTIGCLVLGVVAFVGILGVMIWYGGEPPINVTVAIITGASLFGLFAYLWRHSAIATGRYDIEVDRVLKRVTLPREAGWGLGRFERPNARFEELTVAIERDEDRRVNRSPAWKLHVRASSDAGAHTALWLSRADARRLGEWIARRCGASLEVIGLEADDDE